MHITRSHEQALVKHPLSTLVTVAGQRSTGLQGLRDVDVSCCDGDGVPFGRTALGRQLPCWSREATPHQRTAGALRELSTSLHRCAHCGSTIRLWLLNAAVSCTVRCTQWCCTGIEPLSHVCVKDRSDHDWLGQVP